MEMYGRNDYRNYLAHSRTKGSKNGVYTGRLVRSKRGTTYYVYDDDDKSAAAIAARNAAWRDNAFSKPSTTSGANYSNKVNPVGAYNNRRRSSVAKSTAETYNAERRTFGGRLAAGYKYGADRAKKGNGYASYSRTYTGGNILNEIGTFAGYSVAKVKSVAKKAVEWGRNLISSVISGVKKWAKKTKANLLVNKYNRQSGLTGEPDKVTSLGRSASKIATNRYFRDSGLSENPDYIPYLNRK